MSAQPTPGVLMQMITQNDEKHESGHKRLRNDFRSLDQRVDDLEEALVTTRSDIQQTKEHVVSLETSPTEVSRLKFSPQTVMVIVSTFMTIAGGMWASTYGIRSDVRDILTRMALQAKVDEANTKLQEERAAALRDSIEAMKRRQELQQYEIQGLKEVILTKKR